MRQVKGFRGEMFFNCSHIRFPKIPYVCLIPGGVQAGKAVICKGLALSASEKRFNVNFACGLLVDGDHRDNIAFHFNPRFDEREVVCNTMINNRWGKEERTPSPILPGQAFELRIMILTDCFKVAVNGRHLLDYKHRMTINEIKTLYVQGAVQLDFIQFEGESRPHFNDPYAGVTTQAHGHQVHPSAPMPAMPNPVPTPQVPAAGGIGMPPAFAPSNPNYPNPSAPFIKPPVPFEAKIPGKLYPNRQIFITGVPHTGGLQFQINFKSGQDVAFHFNPRFNEKAIVRNTRRGGQWGPEERESPNFPFVKGGTFDLIFLVDRDGYKVAVNGQHFLVYEHRVPLESVDTIEIHGELRLQQVHIQ